MDDELMYDDPNDDLDRLLDDELEIMREAEAERDKENELPEYPDPPSDVDSPVKSRSPLTSRHRADMNVGLSASQGEKRRRNSSQDSDNGGSQLANSTAPLKAQNKKVRRDSVEPVEEKITREEWLRQKNVSPSRIKIPCMGDRKVYRSIPSIDYQGITGPSGEKYYIRQKSATSDEASKASKQSAGRDTDLCGVPFMHLLDLAEQELAQMNEASEMNSDSVNPSNASRDVNNNSSQLWVDKYKPASYLDLLSDNGTNRTLLTWLKLWDRLVFGVDNTKLINKLEEEANSNRFSVLPKVLSQLDDMNRPQQRVALLHGAPGLGKTTLAHIVAAHAGYKPMEMNASDDRSVDAFKKRLESATQMRSVVTDDQRPNCLIIDEIDGAPAPTINYLVGLLNDNNANAIKKKKKTGHILRPIICICNDLYTPSLKPLRQKALIISFLPTETDRLAERLKEISSQEDFKVDLTALLNLCAKTGNDIRSCLSTLQFFKSKGETLSAAKIAESSVGHKDAQKGLFNVWTDIFVRPDITVNKNKLAASGGSAQVAPMSGRSRAAAISTSQSELRMKKILSVIYGYGDFEKVASGVYENFLAVKLRDSEFSTLERGIDWFEYFDMVHQEVQHSQNYSIAGYLAFSLAAMHFLFASGSRQKLTFPSQGIEHRQKLTQSINVLDTVLGEMQASSRVFSSRLSLVREVLPCVLVITQPSLRAVNTQLYSTKEKAVLFNLINVLIAFNITFQQVRTPDGSGYDYKMDPNIESVVRFNAAAATGTGGQGDMTAAAEPVGKSGMSYNVKQMIAHEIELEKMRRTDGGHKVSGKEAVEEIKASSQESEKARSQDAQPGTPDPAKKTASHLAKLTPKQINLKEDGGAAKDFFGRVIARPTASRESGATGGNSIVKTDVWFKFKEGYSNAVRRTVKIKDLL